MVTKRQLEVIKEVALGKSNKEIGNTLFICERTVKYHLQQIYIKLGLTDGVAGSHHRVQLTAEAIKRGWITL